MEKPGEENGEEKDNIRTRFLTDQQWEVNVRLMTKVGQQNKECSGIWRLLQLPNNETFNRKTGDFVHC